jgi:hypothetical protein
MVENLPPQQIYTFIVKDFKAAWDSIAKNENRTIGRGNFMFGRQAMSLLEFAARYYGRNDELRKHFSEELCKIEPRYFTALPGPVPFNKDFTLPHLDNTSILLWSLFDLIRHGLAHQYQQILVELTDKKYFYISLDGATYHRDLNKVAASREGNYLCYDIETDGTLKLLVDPGRLFLDFEDAIEKSDLLKNASSFQYLSRTSYNFDVKSLENSLSLSNHLKC